MRTRKINISAAMFGEVLNLERAVVTTVSENPKVY